MCLFAFLSHGLRVPVNLAMLLEPVVVYYITAEVSWQGGLLAMAAEKPRERCERIRALVSKAQKFPVAFLLPSCPYLLNVSTFHHSMAGW